MELDRKTLLWASWNKVERIFCGCNEIKKNLKHKTKCNDNICKMKRVMTTPSGMQIIKQEKCNKAKVYFI